MPRPTEAELEILRVLWERQACTVREVHEVLRGGQGGYTTALKLLQVMHAKGLVLRDDSSRAHVYRPAISKDHTQRWFLRDLARRLFDGSSSQLVMQALGSDKASPEELKAIRDMLDELDKGKS
ncbi:MAG TPA: BlaI/MecI/CopY family transcriptional regulator [Frateuria sp.]|uniref:BlaI/MecI/CopY family transcriptional regulator n=1 Tax=Frateuria sp. TaxID=2211372 RepID=UPI002D8003B3|nr:BlaI/MecI/CopY family transcriptional regulator [Frateuria sp.]HET6805288.1 BlaI/MecI/CopY family transcriptional regulator [Frateuria sp.]